VYCGDESVYACGQNGTLLTGRHNQWKIIPTGGISEDFWDVCWFNGKLYVASLTTLYTHDGKCLVPVEFGADRPKTFGSLTHAQGIFWSVGDEDVFSFDGQAWTRVD
jgi:hypothetical protein